MRAVRLIAATFLFLGAYCPAGAHALAHVVNSAHVHGHDDGTVHAHEHDAQDHHETEPHCTDDAPRLVDAGARLAPPSLVARPMAALDTAPFAALPRLVVAASLDPPRGSPQRFSSPGSTGRAPPA